LNIPVEDIVMAVEAAYTPESLFNTCEDNSAIQLIDRINDEYNENESDLIDKIALRQILDDLKPREKQIIILRYFKEKTQVQIAKMLGISQVQVSRIEKKILEELRQKIGI
jgi:RNA polymerase sporulation-specific sigma factor